MAGLELFFKVNGFTLEILTSTFLLALVRKIECSAAFGLPI